ncbi:hypothetical protein [Spirosoma areae]
MLKQQKIFVLLAVVSYLSIILMGQMIGLPFLFWLLFNVFNFGEINQLFAIIGIIGLGLLVKYANRKRKLSIFLIDILCFFLLILPISGRLFSVPIEEFDYAAFIVPLSLFIIFYLISLGYAYRQYVENRFSVG